MSEQWTAKETRVYTGDGGFDIRYLPNATERAALIVKAVNNHEALVKALAGYERFITMMHEMAGENGYKSGIALAQERCRKELDRIDSVMSQLTRPVGQTLNPSKGE